MGFLENKKEGVIIIINHNKKKVDLNLSLNINVGILRDLESGKDFVLEFKDKAKELLIPMEGESVKVLKIMK